MQLTVLAENIAKIGFEGEHGLSYFIEIDGKHILFDTGQSDLFLRNAEKLGIKINDKVDLVVLSHGHWDHGSGLKYLENKTLLTHPKAFQKRYRKKDKTPVGLQVSKDNLTRYRFYRLIQSSGPYQISKNLWFLGEIPRISDFESIATPFILENGDPDYIEDDSALVGIKDNELIIITGCSHAGICNICEYAKDVTGIKKINTVIGGFHLRQKNQQTFKTVKYFENNVVKNLLPSHCTSFSLLSLFNFNGRSTQVKAGKVYNF